MNRPNPLSKFKCDIYCPFMSRLMWKMSSLTYCRWQSDIISSFFSPPFYSSGREIEPLGVSGKITWHALPGSGPRSLSDCQSCCLSPSELKSILGQSELQQRLCNSIRWSQTLEVNKTISVVPPSLPQSGCYPSLPFFIPLHGQQRNKLAHAYSKQTQLPLA